jgi:regulatory protein
MIDVSDFLESHPIRIESEQVSLVVSQKEETTNETEVSAEPTTKDRNLKTESLNTQESQIFIQTQVIHRGTFGSLTDNENYESKRKTARNKRNHAKAGAFGSQNYARKASGCKDPHNEESCREAALTLLDSAARPKKALTERLLSKGYDASVVHSVVERLEELCFVDDQAYAQSFLRYCISRNLGERGTFAEMLRKGLDSSTAEGAIFQARQEGLFVESAYDLGRKIAKKTSGLQDDVRKRRLWSAGGRKGHDPSLIKLVADDLFDSASDAENREIM